MENFLRKKQRKKFEFFSKKYQFGIRKSNIHVTKEYKAPQNNRKKKKPTQATQLPWIPSLTLSSTASSEDKIAH